ncbi:MAG: thiamine-phosphate kinase [Gammaproteobacteria bacterium]|nr:thiamine-phosphate kinase [Gammaproteobacteria bacterium]
MTLEKVIPTKEFSIIETYFKNKTLTRDDVELGIGDDAALLRLPSAQLLVLSTDTLIKGVHFPENTAAYDIGYKALAVNLSDLAAMGALPAWFSLALTLPLADTSWLQDFTQGLFNLAKEFNVQLVGGDTTRGALSITIQALGWVPPHQALRRSGAKVGDKIYVSGTMGDAGLGLQVALGKMTLSSKDNQLVLNRLNQPFPKVKLGMLLRTFATSAIDLSDGLYADLNHILTQSQVGAEINTDNLPLSVTLKKYLSPQDAKIYALTAGDDYELCFTIPLAKEIEFLQMIQTAQMNCTCIGEVKSEPGIQLTGFIGSLPTQGYQHF